MTKKRMISVVVVCALTGVAGRAVARPDTRPAPFPDKAQAVLLSGSSEARFTNDVNSMAGVFTSNANRWQYGAANVQTLTYAGTGASKASVANLQTALTTAAQQMWTKPAREQNFVYVHSSHGLPGDDGSTVSRLGSQMMFGEGAGGGARSSVDFRNMIRDYLRSGHTEYSSNGSSTSCVRTMTFMLEPCFSGGQIYELTQVLPSKENRRKYFPALSDVTVMTAGRYDECTYGLPDDSGNRFMREFYGYGSGATRTSGTLEGMGARSAWSVYETAAQRNIANDGTAWTPDYGFGSGNNAVMHVASTASDGRGNPEHNLYRHVQFYPSITFGEGVDGRVNVRAGNTTLDFRLSEHNRPGSDVPISGPIPIMMTLTNATAGFIQADRDLRPLASLGALPSPDLRFVDYYTFNLTNSGGINFAGGSLMLEMESDDAAAAALLGGLRLFRHDPTNGWVNTNASWNPFQSKFLLDGITSLGTYAVVVPTPGAVVLAGIGGILVLRRRRAA
jgi:hypothetical protein